MARKRNYKAEYARRKARAISRGYSGPKQEYKARKRIGLTRSMPSLSFKELPDFAVESVTGQEMRRIRDASADWTTLHSHVEASRYRGNMSNQQARDYYAAYAAPYDTYGNSRRGKAKGKRRAIKAYMLKYGFKIIEGEREEDWKSDLSA